MCIAALYNRLHRIEELADAVLTNGDDRFALYF